MHTLRSWPGLLATLAGLILLLWSLQPWPNEMRRLQVLLPGGEMGDNTEGAGWAIETASPAAQLDFEWPGRLRAGDHGWVRLRLVLPEQQELSGWWGAARLDLPGLDSYPPGETLVPLVPGEAVDFTWRVQTRRPGKYHGQAWLFLEIGSPEMGRAEMSRYPLTAQRFETHVQGLGNLGGASARLVGILCLVAGLIWIGTGLASRPGGLPRFWLPGGLPDLTNPRGKRRKARE